MITILMVIVLDSISASAAWLNCELNDDCYDYINLAEDTKYAEEQATIKTQP